MTKYRAIRKDNGEWVEGYLMQMYSPERLFIGQWINLGNEARVKDELFTSYHEIIPESLALFTALTDKNGKEIFGSIPVNGVMSRGGDILKLQYPTVKIYGYVDNKEITVTVEFSKGGFWFTGDGYADCNWHFYNDYEIIGNQWESEAGK
jgi:uncharacterized phage protein (TIGR01671 family)